jgi:hypothetical protein
MCVFVCVCVCLSLCVFVLCERCVFLYCVKEPSVLFDYTHFAYHGQLTELLWSANRAGGRVVLHAMRGQTRCYDEAQKEGSERRYGVRQLL